MSHSNENKPAFAPPRTPAEELLTAIYGSLLGIDEVSVFDSFLDLSESRELGGKLAAKLREVFRVEVTLNDVISAPTVDQLVSALAQKWGGREIVDEIAWTFMQVDQLSDSETDTMLRSEVDDLIALNHRTDGAASRDADPAANKRKLVEVLLEKTGITLDLREGSSDGGAGIQEA